MKVIKKDIIKEAKNEEDILNLKIDLNQEVKFEQRYIN